jgi:hypothetical protein
MRTTTLFNVWLVQSLPEAVNTTLKNINMFRLNDIKKLKKGDLISLAESKGIENITKLTKAIIIEKLVSIGCVSVDSSNNVSISLGVSVVCFHSDNLTYNYLCNENFNLLPSVSFENIYRFCCQDASSFRSLDRASKHKTAGDISDLKLCQNGSYVYMAASCLASQKANKYKCFVAIKNDGSIASGHCECPIG